MKQISVELLSSQHHDQITLQNTLIEIVGPDYADDRFKSGQSELAHIAIASGADGQPCGLATASTDNQRLLVDMVLKPLEKLDLDAHNQLENSALKLLVALLNAQVIQNNQIHEMPLLLWSRPEHESIKKLAAQKQLTAYRCLHQMRLKLPLEDQHRPTCQLETIAFRASDYDRELLAVNNRAFANHPDQANHTLQSMRQLFHTPWFSNAGLRLYIDPTSRRLAGFCWTKIHSEVSGSKAGPVGEIYVIGIDPDFQGLGLGRPLVTAGLDWLTDQGIEQAILYVEADNKPAIETYLRLGFKIHHSDRAWLGSSTTLQALTKQS